MNGTFFFMMIVYEHVCMYVRGCMSMSIISRGRGRIALYVLTFFFTSRRPLFLLFFFAFFFNIFFFLLVGAVVLCGWVCLSEEA